MTITQLNYLDFSNLLIFELIGSVTLAIILGLVFIAWLAMKNRLPIQVTLMMSFVWIGVILSVAYNALVWMLALLIVGVIIYAMAPKIFNRR